MLAEKKTDKTKDVLVFFQMSMSLLPVQRHAGAYLESLTWTLRAILAMERERTRRREATRKPMLSSL